MQMIIFMNSSEIPKVMTDEPYILMYKCTKQRLFGDRVKDQVAMYLTAGCSVLGFTSPLLAATPDWCEAESQTLQFQYSGCPRLFFTPVRNVPLLLQTAS